MNVFEINALINELNRVEVKGEANLDVLLGCIKFLKSKRAEVQAKAEKERAEKEAAAMTNEEGNKDG